MLEKNSIFLPPGSGPGATATGHLLVEPQLIAQVNHGHDLGFNGNHWENGGTISWIMSGIYPLVNVYITIEHSPFTVSCLTEKISISMAILHSKLLV